MGSLQAQEIAGLADLESALTWHARSNHYPPLPTTLVVVWRDIIHWANDEKDLDQRFELPSGILWKGESSAPAWAIIEGHHLNAWIANYDD